MKDKKLLFFDLETTNLKPETGNIVQFGGAMIINDEVVDTIDIRCRPIDSTEIAQEALDVIGFTKEEIMDFPEPEIFFNNLIAFLDKHILKWDKQDKSYLGGYNIAFDLPYLTSFFNKMDFKYFGSYTNWRKVDPFPLIQFLDYNDMISLENYKLGTCCEHFGIEIKAHDALSDILASWELYKKVKVKFLEMNPNIL